MILKPFRKPIFNHVTLPQTMKEKADNRARILAWLNQLDNQVKMADEKNILPSEVRTYSELI